jgi:peptidoglycan/xylan/chitin deacetylase (PgdA/CDA1 family)
MIRRDPLPLLLACALLVPSPGSLAGEAPLCPAPGTAREKVIERHAPAGRIATPATTGLPAPAPLAPGLAGSIRRVELPAGEKLLALTFDLCEVEGEVAGYDGGIVDELRRRKIPATFFVGGHWAATHPGRYAELAADPLFEVGNHTWSHANLRLAEGAELDRQVLAPEAAFRAVRTTTPVCGAPPVADPKRSTLFRFPYGACDARSMAAVDGAGMAAIQWDVSTGDPSPAAGARDIVEDTLRGVRPGSIVLAHANGRGFHTAEALPRLIDTLTARGWRFVTVSDLLARGRPVVAESCYDAKPGDTERWDARIKASRAAKKAAPTAPPHPGE